MSRSLLLGSALLAIGCVSSPPAVPSEAVPPPPAPAEPTLVAPDEAAPPPPAVPTAADLAGEWVEYWAVSGATDTQRYTFGPDGRFEWHAAPGAPDPARRWGAFRIEGTDLVLACEDQPPVEQRLQLGECPPNVEAKALDANYRCLSIGGHAFWRSK